MSGSDGVHPTRFYAVLAIVLAIITGIELGPLFEWFEIPALGLLILSAVKFFLVAALFMHLWDDPKIFTQVFVIPLIGAGLMVAVLMMLFGGFWNSPLEDKFPVRERYWANYNQECSSWLRSSRTHKLYCASPEITLERMAMYEPKEGPYTGPEVDVDGMDAAAAKTELVNKGEELYGLHCAVCHQADGAGQAGTYPPLAGSDYIADAGTHVDIILNGLNGPIVVNGENYNGAMMSFGAKLSDGQIAAIATFERNAWGNDMGVVMPADVKAQR